MYYFVNEVTDKNGPLPMTRDLNKECYFLIYDLHDMWHFMSAFALLFQAMMLYHIDDDLIILASSKETVKLRIF